MSNIDKHALREAAEKAISEEGETWWIEDQLASDYGLALHRTDAKFIAAANPANVLALLDELEAKDKLIDILRQDKDKVIDTSKERISKLLARVAELESSHSNLREAMAGIHNTINAGGAYTPLASILNASKRAYEESAAAAGKGDAS
ncbi:ead/Ea22-like family protein [Enterobacter hormaechei]|uniref:ead/Ea22-like family protein n=1 Tax=Enterobacter hormaechei TaxID=158836 RepID=UPI003B9B5919